MESYDEDLNENPFFKSLKDSYPELFTQCVKDGWIICVPRRQSLPKYAFTIEDFMESILKPIENDTISPEQQRSRRPSRVSRPDFDSVCSSLCVSQESVATTVDSQHNNSNSSNSSSSSSISGSSTKSKWNYKTLSHVNVNYCINQYVKLDETTTELVAASPNKLNNNNDSTNNVKNRRRNSLAVKILFEETFYTPERQKYKVLCVESPLYSKMVTENDSDSDNNHGEVDELWNLTTLRDCIDFLWVKGKLRVLESYDAYIKLFLHNHRTLENLPIAIQRDLVYTLYLKCLNFAMNFEVKGDSLQLLKVATETFVLNGVYRFLMGAITSATSIEDGALNKIIRNLSEIHPSDLDIDPIHWDNLTRARQELGRLDIHSSPLSKLKCLKKTLRHMRPDSSVEVNEAGVISTDELLPIWVYLIVRTPLGNWNAQLQYLKTFRFSAEDSEGNDNENNFYIATLEASLVHLKTGKVLGLASAGERDVGVPTELSDAWFHALNHNNEEPSDPFLAEMFSAIKLGNSTRLEELITEYEEERKAQKIEVHQVDPSLLCHPLCDCDKCMILTKPVNTEAVMVPAVELASEDDLTLLHMACIYGRPKIVDYLIINGALIEVNDTHGSVPLHYAASRGHQNALLLLLHAGANMEPLDKMLRTPLHLAAQNGHEACVKALLYYAEHTRQSINVSPRDFNGNTPLHDASRWGFQGIVQILVENGALISILNNRLSTPVDCAHDVHIVRILQRSARRRSWVPPNHGDFINIEVIPKSEDSDGGILMLISEPMNTSQDESTDAEDSPFKEEEGKERERKLSVYGNQISQLPVPSSMRARRHSATSLPTSQSANNLTVGPPNNVNSNNTSNNRQPKFRRHSSIVVPSLPSASIPEDRVVHHDTPEPPVEEHEEFVVDSLPIPHQEVRRISREESQSIRKVSVESLDNIAVAILPELPAVMGVKRKRDNQSRDMRKLRSTIDVGDLPLALFYLGIPAEELDNEENQKDKIEQLEACHPLCRCKNCHARAGGLGIDINQKNAEGKTILMHAVECGLLLLVKILYKFGANINTKSSYESKSALIFAREKGYNEIADFLLKHGALED